MRFLIKITFVGWVILCCCTPATAQTVSSGSLIYSTEDHNTISDSAGMYIIRNILISGNRKTQSDVILRELSFQIDESYTLNDITNEFRKARKQLMNTGLFRNVVVSLKSMDGFDVYVSVQVEEKWYIWPKPFVRPVDKTFHEWWTEKDRSMDRINYGIKLVHNNFTGRNDKLRLTVMNGFTKQLSVQYYGLFLDQQLKWSVNGGFSLGKNRELNYITIDNRPVPVRSNDSYLRSYISWFAEVNFRPAIKTRHTIGIGYNSEDIADTVYKLNPYFSRQPNGVSYPELWYRLSYFDVDFISYPQKGEIAEILLRKKGFSKPFNIWQLTAKGSKYWPLNKNYFFNLSAVGIVKLPFRQPYMNNHFIGHEEQYIQGYEYYVIDGVAGGYSKATVTRQLVNTEIRIRSRKFQGLNHIPFKVYAKTFVNAGYVYCSRPGQNQLTNTFLYSGGVGLDIVAFTDFVIKLEWSFNRLGENGLYLHRRNYF